MFVERKPTYIVQKGNQLLYDRKDTNLFIIERKPTLYTVAMEPTYKITYTWLKKPNYIFVKI